MVETVTNGKKRSRVGWKEGLVSGAGSVQATETTETAHEESHLSNGNKGKRKRGRTCLQVMTTGENERKLVEWNTRGQPIEDVSVKFSTTLGVIIREQVPITKATWHDVKDEARDNLWKLLMQKYIVDVCFKPFILQQMGKLWRSWKSDISVEIRNIEESQSTKTKRTNLIAKLKPIDVSAQEWDIFVQSRMTEEWQEKSKKMRDIRAKQTITHTMSQQGYARLEEKHNKNHPNEPLTKPKLWIKGHEQKKKNNPVVAAKIAEIQSKMDESQPTEEDPQQEEILTQVLGKERPGRIRGLGAGVSKTKLYAHTQNDRKYEQLRAELRKERTHNVKFQNAIAAKLGINLSSLADEDDDCVDDESGQHACKEHGEQISKSGQGSTHLPSLADKCKLRNWNGNGEVVAVGTLSAIDPNSKVHGYTLGPDVIGFSLMMYLWKGQNSIGLSLNLPTWKMRVEAQ